jgi:hypothetical protein
LRRFSAAFPATCAAIVGITAAACAETPPPAIAKAADKVAPDIRPEALWEGRKMVPFRAADAPKMVPASEATNFLDDDEYVLGLTVDGESRAYPTRFVWWHHFVNDTVGKKAVPVLVSYCSVCNTGIRFDPTVDGTPRKFDFYGLYNGVVTMCDRETDSVWLQVEGRAVKGPLTGKRLKTGPLLDTTWGQWKKLHPDTLVMSPNGPFEKVYRPKGAAEPRGHDRFPLPFFRQSMTRGDKRLPPFEKVLGVAVPDATDTPLRRAYPIKALRDAGNVVNETVGAVSVVVLLDPKTVTAAAFSPVVENRKLTFEARTHTDGTTAFFDKETGTRWSVDGAGREGALAGKTLAPVENHLSQWYGWVAYFPQTTIYGRDDPPQSIDLFANPTPGLFGGVP